MAFMAQIRLSDVPGAEDAGDTLASFHYCEECTHDGAMSFGWDDRDPPPRRYDVRFFEDAATLVPDGLGARTPPVLPSRSVRLRRVVEVPTPLDVGLEDGDSPDDYPSGEDDLDENLYRGLLHVPRSKIGGWPSWVQETAWPRHDRTWRFLAQFDWVLGADASWGGGGYAYLFFRRTRDRWEGELGIQTT